MAQTAHSARAITAHKGANLQLRAVKSALQIELHLAMTALFLAVFPYFFPYTINRILMESTRQQKISRLLQKELSEIFLLQTKSMAGTLVSVSKCYISPDMSICRAYLSVFPSERSEEIVANINGNVPAIRFELGKRVRHQLRIIPELKFFVDDSLDYLENIDRLLQQ